MYDIVMQMSTSGSVWSEILSSPFSPSSLIPPGWCFQASCQLASDWVWPTGGSGRRVWRAGGREKVGYFSLSLCTGVLSLAAAASLPWLQPSPEACRSSSFLWVIPGHGLGWHHLLPLSLQPRSGSDFLLWLVSGLPHSPLFGFYVSFISLH